MEHWDYRVLKDALDGEHKLSIHKVYYDTGKPISFVKEPVQASLGTENKRDLLWLVYHMKIALDRPTLNKDDLRSI